MAFDLSSISTEKVMRPPRVILLGTEKIGKSTFASQAPKPIFLPVAREEGIDDLEVSKFPPAESYGDVVEAIKTLISEDHGFQTLVIDSSSALEPLIHAEICRISQVDSIEKVGGGYGKGYIEAVSKWQELMVGLDKLRNEKRMAVFLIGHVTTKAFNDPLTESYTQYAWDVNAKAASALQRWADCILFANIKTFTKKEESGFNKTENKAQSSGQRYLYTNARPTHPGGGRGVYGRLPYEIPFTYGDWSGAIATANNK